MLLRPLRSGARPAPSTAPFPGGPRLADRACSNIVDIFEIAPHENIPRAAPPSYAVAGQEARVARYQSLLSKLAATDELGSDAVVDWTPHDDDTIEMQGGIPTINVAAGEPLVGYFADAARIPA